MYVGKNIAERKLSFSRVRSVLKGYVLTKWIVLTKWNAALSWAGRWPYRHWNAYWNVWFERSGEKDNWYINTKYFIVRLIPRIPGLISSLYGAKTNLKAKKSGWNLKKEVLHTKQNNNVITTVRTNLKNTTPNALSSPYPSMIDFVFFETATFREIFII